MPDRWGHDPEPLDNALSDNTVPCPLCDRVFLEVGPMKIHFEREHGVRYDEWKAQLP